MPEEQEKPTTEEVTLHSAGSVPGIPGSHGPGTYLVNWIERTIQRVEDALHISKPEPAEEAPAEPALVEPSPAEPEQAS